MRSLDLTHEAPFSTIMLVLVLSYLDQDKPCATPNPLKRCRRNDPLTESSIVPVSVSPPNVPTLRAFRARKHTDRFAKSALLLVLGESDRPNSSALTRHQSTLNLFAICGELLQASDHA